MNVKYNVKIHIINFNRFGSVKKKYPQNILMFLQSDTKLASSATVGHGFIGLCDCLYDSLLSGAVLEACRQSEGLWV